VEFCSDLRFEPITPSPDEFKVFPGEFVPLALDRAFRCVHMRSITVQSIAPPSDTPSLADEDTSVSFAFHHPEESAGVLRRCHS
jgi:hypothetical protein